MAHYTLFTDGNYELTTGWDKTGVHINIHNSDWRENPGENCSITLNSYDIKVLIEELELYADAVDAEIEKQNNPTKSEKQDMLADALTKTINK